MSSVMEKRQLFYTTCIPFFIFFVAFDTIIYPNKSNLQPSLEVTKAFLGGANGGALEILAKIFANWTSALYFVVAGKFVGALLGVCCDTEA